MLTDMQLKLLSTNNISTKCCSPTYLSTSKFRQVAQFFGNAVRTIDIRRLEDKEGKTVDISTIPDEEVVLLTPKYKLFKRKESKLDPTLKKYIIHLMSTRSFPCPVIRKDRYNPSKTRRLQKTTTCSTVFPH